MPFYPYICDICCKYEETFIRLTEYDTAPRPQCCGVIMRRIFTPPMVISDDLGLRGVVNPLNGKPYDSKSAYYRAVKDAGCHIIDDNAPKPQSYQGDHNITKELKEAVQTVLNK